MKPLLLSIGLIAFLSSCTHYNYYTISGKNVPKTETNQLVSENDTLRIEYQFSDHGGKIGFKIINKSDEIVEVDWRKSAIIAGGKAVSYFNPAGLINGRIERDTLAENGSSFVADVRASFVISEPVQYIFPRSHLQKISFGSLKENILVRELRKDEGEFIKLPERGVVSVSYRKVQFSPEQTPLSFRSFLTFRIGKGADQKEFSLEHLFYISEHWQSTSASFDFPEEIVRRSDWLSLTP